MRIAEPREIRIFMTSSGSCPFEEWWLDLRSPTAQAIIAARIEKIRQGSDSNEKALGDGIYESKIYSGPGYRIYFGKEDQSVVILLCGGTKQRQSADIKKAKLYWREYQEKHDAKTK